MLTKLFVWTLGCSVILLKKQGRKNEFSKPQKTIKKYFLTVGCISVLFCMIDGIFDDPFFFQFQPPKLCFFSWFCSLLLIKHSFVPRGGFSSRLILLLFYLFNLGILVTSLFSCSESSQKCIKVIKYFKYFHCYFQNKNCSSWLCMNFRTNFSFHGINFYSREFFKETNRIFSHFSSLVLPTNLGHVFQCCLQFQNVSVSLLQKKGWTAKIFCKMKLFFSFWATESKMHLSVWCRKKGFPENTTSDM